MHLRPALARRSGAWHRAQLQQQRPSPLVGRLPVLTCAGRQAAHHDARNRAAAQPALATSGVAACGSSSGGGAGGRRWRCHLSAGEAEGLPGPLVGGQVHQGGSRGQLGFCHRAVAVALAKHVATQVAAARIWGWEAAGGWGRDGRAAGQAAARKGPCKLSRGRDVEWACSAAGACSAEPLTALPPVLASQRPPTRPNAHSQVFSQRRPAVVLESAQLLRHLSALSGHALQAWRACERRSSTGEEGSSEQPGGRRTHTRAPHSRPARPTSRSLRAWRVPPCLEHAHAAARQGGGRGGRACVCGASQHASSARQP